MLLAYPAHYISSKSITICTLSSIFTLIMRGLLNVDVDDRRGVRSSMDIPITEFGSS